MLQAAVDAIAHSVSVSVAEVVFGLRRVGREDRLAQFEASLQAVEVLPFDGVAARKAGRINADLERQGLIIGLPDVMIAAIAICNGLVVVTGNVVGASFHVARMSPDVAPNCGSRWDERGSME